MQPDALVDLRIVEAEDLPRGERRLGSTDRASSPDSGVGFSDAAGRILRSYAILDSVQQTIKLHYLGCAETVLFQYEWDGCLSLCTLPCMKRLLCSVY